VTIETDGGAVNAGKRSGENAIIYRHSAVFGIQHDPVRKFEIGSVEPYAQYEKSVSIKGVSSGRRRWRYFRVTGDNLSYYIIKNAAGRELYDSRADVPCDMAKWQEAADEMKQRYAGRST
jgi:hypothetical protein